MRSAEEFARVLVNMGRIDEAEQLMQGVLEVADREMGEAHVQTLYVAGVTTEILMARGKFAEAERVARHYVDAFRRTDQGGGGLAIALRILTMVLAEQGKDDGIDAGREAVERAIPVFTESRFLIAKAQRAYAIALYKARTKADVAASERVFGESLGLYRSLFGQDHTTVGETLLAWGRMEHAAGRHELAVQKYREAEGVFVRLGRDTPYTLAEIRAELGGCLAELGRDAEAQPLLVSGYEILREKRGDADGMAVAALRRLAAFYDRTGRGAEAEELRRRVPAEVTTFLTLRALTGLR